MEYMAVEGGAVAMVAVETGGAGGEPGPGAGAGDPADAVDRGRRGAGQRVGVDYSEVPAAVTFAASGLLAQRFMVTAVDDAI